MIGLEVFAITFETDFLIVGCMAILLALIAPMIAVATHLLLLKPFQTFSKGAIPIMTWGGALKPVFQLLWRCHCRTGNESH